MPTAKPAKKSPGRSAAKPAKTAASSAKPAKAAASSAKPIGRVTHFFDKISVAIVKMNAGLKTGDKVRFEGHGKSFEQAVASMQVEHEKIAEAKKGQEIGLKVSKPVKEGDLVFKA